MIVATFRGRLMPDIAEEYEPEARKMSAMAATIPGYRSHKQFLAADGEFLTLVEFESEEALRLWARHPDHVQAKRNGRRRYYSEYQVRVCSVIRESSFTREEAS